jgi:hypothetical protein
MMYFSEWNPVGSDFVCQCYLSDHEPSASDSPLLAEFWQQRLSNPDLDQAHFDVDILPHFQGER